MQRNSYITIAIIIVICLSLIALAQLTTTATKIGTEGKYLIELKTETNTKTGQEVVKETTITNVNHTKGSNSIWDMVKASKTYEAKTSAIKP